MFECFSANCLSVGEELIFIGCADGIVRCFSPHSLQVNSCTNAQNVHKGQNIQNVQNTHNLQNIHNVQIISLINYVTCCKLEKNKVFLIPLS